MKQKNLFEYYNFIYFRTKIIGNGLIVNQLMKNKKYKNFYLKQLTSKYIFKSNFIENSSFYLVLLFLNKIFDFFISSFYIILNSYE